MRGGARPARGAARRDRRRRPALAGRALARPGARARRRALDARRAADAPAARDRSARLRGLDRHRGYRRTRTSSTCCACSRSAWRRERPSSPRCASTPRCTGSRRSASVQARSSCIPGPMNRGVEIDPRVADSEAALVGDQVRAGLVVRMAVLYDLLTVDARRRRPRCTERSRSRDARLQKRPSGLADARRPRRRPGAGHRRVPSDHRHGRCHRASSRRVRARS